MKAAIATTLVILVALLPASASEGASAVVLDAYAAEGPGWVTTEIVTKSENARVSFAATGGELPMQFGVQLFDDAGRLAKRFVLTWLGPDDVIAVESGNESLVSIDVPTKAPFSSAGATIELPGVGENRTWRVVLWLAGNVDGLNYAVEGHADTKVISRSEGSSTFFLTERDFVGTHRAAARLGVAGAHTLIQGSVTIYVGDNLVGAFDHGPAVVGALEVEHPSGVSRCPCQFDGGATPGALAGDHHFRASAIGAGTTAASTLYLAGALPRYSWT